MDIINSGKLPYSINWQTSAKSFRDAQARAIKICIKKCQYRATFHSDGGWV